MHKLTIHNLGPVEHIPIHIVLQDPNYEWSNYKLTIHNLGPVEQCEGRFY